MARTVLIPPREHCWVASDAYDRSAFAELSAATPTLAELAARGGALVPCFRELLEDFFCLLFKLDPRLRAADEVAPAAAFNRALLATLDGHPALAALRAETQLDEAQAGLGALLLGTRVLEALRAEQLVPRGDLLDLWDLARQEDELRRRGEEADALAEAPRAAREEATHAARVAEARLRQKAQNVAQRLGEMPGRARTMLPAAAAALAPELADVAREARAWGTGIGAGGRLSPARQIELGRRLVTNPKLRRLAALVGRMRAHALALRRRTLERANAEVHAVEWGDDFGRLLPPELLALRHPLLRRDFRRRLLEGELLVYRLRGAESGRGPMIVCVDGSSSMAGEKEVWAKAVALTLLEIARRQRRLFRFVCFAAADTPLFTLDLNPRAHHAVHVDRALDVAEYFPGGRTDFETPLDAAVDALGAARWRRGDVVLITDGECDVSPAWLARFRREKARLGFALFSVLIDVGGGARTGTLAALSDRVTSASRLTDDDARARGPPRPRSRRPPGRALRAAARGAGGRRGARRAAGGQPPAGDSAVLAGRTRPGAQRLLLVLRARQALDRGGAGAPRAAPRARRRGDRDGPPGRGAGARRPPPAPRRRVDHALRAARALPRLAGIGHGGAGDGRHARRERPPRRPPAARARAPGLSPGLRLRGDRHRERAPGARGDRPRPAHRREPAGRGGGLARARARAVSPVGARRSPAGDAPLDALLPRRPLPRRAGAALHRGRLDLPRRVDARRRHGRRPRGSRLGAHRAPAGGGGAPLCGARRLGRALYGRRAVRGRPAPPAPVRCRAPARSPAPRPPARRPRLLRAHRAPRARTDPPLPGPAVSARGLDGAPAPPAGGRGRRCGAGGLAGFLRGSVKACFRWRQAMPRGVGAS